MTLRERLHAGEPVLGGWLQIAHPTAAEAMRESGLDFLCVDAEHGDGDLSTITNTLRGMGDVPGFVRVRENDTLAIRQALDCGAQGILVPLVETAEGARHAVRAAKYPPEGVRGFAFVRANGWGSRFDAYAQAANRETAVIVMIESALAIENIDAILSVEGLDGVLIGPYDLAGSYGVIGQTDHPLVHGARREMLAACKRHGKAAGFHLVSPTPQAIAALIAEGFTLLALGMDTVFIADGARRAVAHAKKATAQTREE